MRRLASLFVAVALIAVACGDSDGGDGLSEAEQALADAIKTEILADADPDSPFGEAEAQCVGDEAVREFGVDGLLELGFTTEGTGPDNILENATPEQRQKLIDVTLGCVDFAAVLVDAIASEGQISEESAECIGDGLTEGNLLEPLVESGLEGTSFDEVVEEDPDTATAFLDVFLSCLSAEELIELGN